jgi:hypothetical protein
MLVEVSLSGRVEPFAFAAFSGTNQRSNQQYGADVQEGFHSLRRLYLKLPSTGKSRVDNNRGGWKLRKDE